MFEIGCFVLGSEQAFMMYFFSNVSCLVIPSKRVQLWEVGMPTVKRLGTWD